jgi:hypothetical protein
MPQRIQLSRARGWRMPPDTVKVDRSTRWGNPFVAATPAGRAHAVAQFRAYIGDPQQRAFVEDASRVLRGKNLACWCPLDGPCHADVLLEVVNR